MGRTGRSLSLGRSQLGSRVRAGSRGPWLPRLSQASRGKATPQGSSCPEAGHRFWEKERPGPGPGRGWVLSSLSPQDLPPPTPPILPTGAAVGDPGVPSASGDTLLGVSGRSSHPRQLLHGLRVRGAEPDREAAHQGGQGQQHGRGVRQGRQHLEGAPRLPAPSRPHLPPQAWRGAPPTSGSAERGPRLRWGLPGLAPGLPPRPDSAPNSVSLSEVCGSPSTLPVKGCRRDLGVQWDGGCGGGGRKPGIGTPFSGRGPGEMPPGDSPGP